MATHFERIPKDFIRQLPGVVSLGSILAVVEAGDHERWSNAVHDRQSKAPLEAWWESGGDQTQKREPSVKLGLVGKRN